MPVGSDHIVKSFDDELKHLNQVIAQMGGLAEAQLQMAIEALARRDTDSASEVMKHDARINQLEDEIGVLTVRVPQRPEARPRRISVTAS